MSDLPDYIRRARVLSDYEVGQLDLVQSHAVIRALQHQIREISGQEHIGIITSFFTACRDRLRETASSAQEIVWVKSGFRPAEIKLLAALLQVSPRCLSKAQLLDAIDSDSTVDIADDKVIDVHVARIKPLLATMGYALSLHWGRGRFIDNETAHKMREDISRYRANGALPKMDWTLASQGSHS